MYRWFRENRAFTLVEIMIVVAIIGMLIAIALPSLVKARDTARLNLCKNNLRIIYNALEQWRVETNASDSDEPASMDTLGEYIRGGMVTCPSDGIYSFGDDPNEIVCSIHGTYNVATGEFEEEEGPGGGGASPFQ